MRPITMSRMAALVALIMLPSSVLAEDVHSAARNGDAEGLSVLLEAGADPHAADGVVGTPLHWTAARGHVEAARVLLQAGAAVDAAGAPPVGLTPLQLAASSGQTEIVRLLIDAGARIDTGTGGYGTPLHLAALGDHAETVLALLEAGAATNALSTRDQGPYPLHWAAQSGGAQAILALIARGADIDAADRAGTTALHLAVFSLNLDAVHVLLDLGADPHARSTYHDTPTTLAGQHPDTAALFAELGIE